MDKKIKGHVLKYLIQCTIAALSLYMILVSMEYFFKAAIVASIGATSFIIFAMPKSKWSNGKFILGGYCIGAICGSALYYLGQFLGHADPNVMAALAVGIAMFIMVITDNEHPPAAALALGIVVEGFSLNSLVFTFGVTIFLLTIKWLLRNWLIDLI